jgi:hypothetical protein
VAKVFALFKINKIQNQSDTMKKLLFAALSVFLLYGCNQKEQNEDQDQATDPLHEQTTQMLAIHDSIMPHMDKLMDLKKQLKEDLKRTDSLLLLQSGSGLNTHKAEAVLLVSQLDSADHAMMGWMHGFKMDTLKKLNEAEAETYIARQKKDIEAVRNLMNKSIADANRFIEKIER